MTGIGVIGCGMVSHAYLGTIAREAGLELVALASRTMVSAQAQAARYGGRPTSVEGLLDDPGVEVVVNLAPPGVHHALGRRVLASGRHLYSEKPFATSLADAADLLCLAEACGLSIGCAPDTFLGEGQQTSRRLLDEGAIGRVVGGSVAFGTRGMEAWHPDPAFFFAPGGGPLLDVGPYYVTQLVNLLGPVASVSATATTPRSERVASAPGREGQRIAVDVPTTVTGSLLFANGANVSLSVSWDVVAHTRPPIELYGDAGTLTAPDPNRFEGRNSFTRDGREWTSFGADPSSAGMDDASLAHAVARLVSGTDPVTGGPVGPDTPLRFGDRRGLGLLDMVEGLASGRPPRASGKLAYHVLEVLLGLDQSAQSGTVVSIASTAARPEPFTLPEPAPIMKA